MAAFPGPYYDTSIRTNPYIPQFTIKCWRINEMGFREKMTWEGMENELPKNVLRAGWKKIKK